MDTKKRVCFKGFVSLDDIPTSVKGRGNVSPYTEVLFRLAKELKTDNAGKFVIKNESDYSSVLQIVARHKLPLRIIKRGEDIFVVKKGRELK